MQFEIENGDFVGTAEWQGPGQVALDMPDGTKRDWFSRYFEAEDSVMGGPVDCAEMTSERRDASQEAFQRAAFQLAAYAYTVRAKGDSRRHEART
ncbi:MAG TPA: hypothetical protein VJ927_06740 [Actinomycetota bacterium]|nr:hypothetical protein [Actinomycetota bacterium]